MKDHFQTDTVRTLVGVQTLTYVNECHLRPDLIFHIGWIGESSWVTQPVAYQGETPVLLALATLVSTRDGTVCPIPDGLRHMLEARRLTVPA